MAILVGVLTGFHRNPCQTSVPLLVPGMTMTLDELRARFWWLGPGKGKDSHIVALEGDTVTIKVIQCTWNRRTQRYEEAVAADFAALGLKVIWQPFWSEKLRTEIEKAREEEMKAGRLFDEAAFVRAQREAELRRGTRG
jgi:hypothetical protein